MILVDTNVIVALIDERDQLHERAVRDVATVAGTPLGVTSLVLVETCFLAPTWACESLLVQSAPSKPASAPCWNRQLRRLGQSPAMHP